MHINFSNLSFRMTTTGPFFVIGSSGVPNVDLLFTDEIVESVFKNDENLPQLPLGDDSPYGIILLFSTSVLPLKQFTMPKINGVYREIPLTEYFKRIIRTHAQDIVVYARKSPVERCDVFEHIWPDTTILESSMKYLVRNWDFKSSPSERYSLNRCTPEVLPFQPTSFQRDTESPGQQNPCRGAFIFTEDIIDEIAPLVPPGPEEMELTACTSAEANVPQARFAEIDQYILAASVTAAMKKAKDACVADQGGATDFVRQEGMEAINSQITTRSMDTSSMPLYLQNNFNPDWIELAKPYLSNNAEVLQ
ncbi:unnamed protein product [Orchesella dallaii]|uniref:Uncharacterized protein n=1 Tax=Orchesella dallaii TaxID=48710 RepID=A0ABP1QSA6_9HEXA